MPIHQSGCHYLLNLSESIAAGDPRVTKELFCFIDLTKAVWDLGSDRDEED